MVKTGDKRVYVRCGQLAGDDSVYRRCVTRVSSFFGALEYETAVGYRLVTVTSVKLTTTTPLTSAISKILYAGISQMTSCATESPSPNSGQASR